MVSILRTRSIPATRVLIVEDVPQVREDLRTILMLVGDIEVVGEASNGLEAVKQVGALHPEVILMDLEMPVLNGYEAALQIKHLYPACRIIVLSVHGYEAARQKAAQAGVDGFIVKGSSIEALIQAILTGKNQNFIAL